MNDCINAILDEGRAVAQVVSRRLPISAVRVRFQISSFRICGLQNGTGTGFLQVLRLQLLILIPPNSPYSPIILWPNLCSLDTDVINRTTTILYMKMEGHADVCIIEFLNTESIAPTETHQLIGTWQSMWAQLGVG
jgi:hypothetical protein